MGDVKRRNARNRSVDPESLAEQLPEHLKKYQRFDSVADLKLHANEIAAWLNDQVPGAGESLLAPVMRAARLDVAFWYRRSAMKPAQPTTPTSPESPLALS
jgi:hypothetical protein